jgi:hypothetical protein
MPLDAPHPEFRELAPMPAGIRFLDGPAERVMQGRLPRGLTALARLPAAPPARPPTPISPSAARAILRRSTGRRMLRGSGASGPRRWHKKSPARGGALYRLGGLPRSAAGIDPAVMRASQVPVRVPREAPGAIKAVGRSPCGAFSAIRFGWRVHPIAIAVGIKSVGYAIGARIVSLGGYRQGKDDGNGRNNE